MTESNHSEPTANRQAILGRVVARSGYPDQPAPNPPPVLWRDHSPILNVGDVGFLTGPPNSGRREIALHLAAAGAMAEGEPGAACGLRVRPGNALLIDYETPAAWCADWLDAMGLGAASERIAQATNPKPLWVRETAPALFKATGWNPNGPEAAQLPAKQGDYWPGAFEVPAPLRLSLVVVNGLAGAFGGRPFDVSGAAAFMANLYSEARARGFAVLMVAEDGPTARAGPTPAKNAIAGHSVWFELAHSVLHLRRGSGGYPANRLEGRLCAVLGAVRAARA